MSQIKLKILGHRFYVFEIQVLGLFIVSKVKKDQ